MMRLDRLLANLAVGSRQQVKALVRQGRVLVEGVPATDAGMQVAEGAHIAVDGEPLDTRLQRHLLMNKPVGLLTAARDSRQETVMSLLPPMYHSLKCMPIGRLDKDTEGLLLFTTDGQVAHRLLDPKIGVSKVYEAQVEGLLTEEAVRRFQAGVALKGFVALPATLEILSADATTSHARVTVREGKYHQVRRMFAACGHPVLALKRTRFGPLTLDDTLAPGQWRELTAAQWQALCADGGQHA